MPSHRAAFYFKHCPDFCVQSGFSADRHTQTHIQISCFSLSVWEKRECEPLEYSAHLRVSTLCDQPFSWLHQQQPAQLFHAQLFLKPWKAHPATPHKAGSIILPLCGVYVWFKGMCVSLFFFLQGYTLKLKETKTGLCSICLRLCLLFLPIISFFLSFFLPSFLAVFMWWPRVCCLKSEHNVPSPYFWLSVSKLTISPCSLSAYRSPL